MLIAEDLLLQLYDDESGRPRFDGNQVSHALAGAVLVELSMRGKVGVAEPGENVKKGRLVVRDAEPTGDDVLDTALTRLARDREKKPKDVLGALRKGKREVLLERLADSGTIRQERRKVLGLFPMTRWLVVDVAHKVQVRERMRTALAGGIEPDERTAALVSLLFAVDGVTKVIPCDDKRAAKRRAKEISESAWAGEAVRQAVKDVNTAVTVAVAAAAVTSAGGGS